jgi:hypothetical protein
LYGDAKDNDFAHRPGGGVGSYGDIAGLATSRLAPTRQ